MRFVIAFAMTAMLLSAAEGSARASRPVEIPKAAVESAPGTYRFTDADGKKWIYRKTPFGVARIPDEPVAAKPVSTEGIKATDAGEFVKFERPGPFGTYRWQTRKSELNDTERAAWDRVRGN